ncbi:hypothetical protein NBH00_00885 [Paraconexibacter antarcticus]|uniref:Lipoprotein n=1 Tax=Paraconexibacter antarcticus TaxID=2949664 RepID=A0ABY5DRX6_9ACTN|nr:hypothetical protein [Paraconexibacter antarcticus]UTI64778.1 hypothetical protein NBH00_00885 [Paraconexibacter antarcticus]
MQATRGFLASLGAGLSLIVAGTLALTFCSAIIAYEGWPGVRVQRTADERALVAAVQGGPAGGVTERVSLRLPAAVSRHRRAAARRAASATARRRTHATRTLVGVVSPRSAVAALGAGPAGASMPATTAVAPAAKSAKKLTVPAAGQAVSQVGSTLGTTVTKTGKTLGDALAPAAPNVATALTDAAASAGQAVTDTTTTVGRAVDELVKP